MFVFSRDFVRIMLAAMVGFAIVLGVGTVYQLRTGYERPTEVAVDWTATSASVWYGLREAGCVGRRGDGVERIYCPVGVRVDVDGRTFEVFETGVRETGTPLVAASGGES